MDANVEVLLKQAADYVAATQPVLDAHALQMRKLAEQAQRTVGVLTNRGVLDRSKADDFVRKTASDPAFALQFLEKLAGLVGADPVGAPSALRKIAADKVDPVVKADMPEFVDNGGGMID